MPTTAKLLLPLQRSMEAQKHRKSMVESIERLCGEIAVKTGELEDDLKVNCENMKNAHYDNW